MPELDEGFLRANAEADEVFGRLMEVVEERVNRGEQQLPVLDIVREAGLELDDRVLADLQLPDVIPVHRFLEPRFYFPWRPIYCWWWRYRYSWYRCPCGYWWWRCHWWVD
jgi:hypothetical protein